MTLETEYPSGAQRWTCYTCGREVVYQWQPKIKNVVLIEGDSTVAHSGRIGIQAPLQAEGEDQFPTELKDQIDEVLGNIAD